MTKVTFVYIIHKVCETLNINLFDVFTQLGKIRTECVEYKDDEFLLDGVSYRINSASDINLKFENLKAGQILLTGDFECVLEIPCDRCLKPVNRPIKLSFNKELVSEENRVECDDDDEFYGLNGNEFDVIGFVNQELLMSMPSKVLCKEDCLGLCPVCGCDRNTTTCECDTFVPDPRMAGIMDIFKGNKEV